VRRENNSERTHGVPGVRRKPDAFGPLINGTSRMCRCGACRHEYFDGNAATEDPPRYYVRRYGNIGKETEAETRESDLAMFRWLESEGWIELFSHKGLQRHRLTPAGWDKYRALQAKVDAQGFDLEAEDIMPFEALNDVLEFTGAAEDEPDLKDDGSNPWPVACTPALRGRRVEEVDND
jgi:hypothetical protein